jgi:AraC family transcriptional regulator
MAKPTVSGSATLSGVEALPAIPMLVRSSELLGWDGLVVREYNEPRTIEGWLDAVVPEPVLVLVTQGAMQLEYQRTNGTWNALPFRQGDLSLRPGGWMTGLVRWSSDCTGPLQTLHLHLQQQFICRIAEELGSYMPTNLTLSRRMGFQDPLLSQLGFALSRELAQQDCGGGKLYAETAAQLLAVHLLRRYTCTPVSIPEPTQGLTRRQLDRVLEFLLAHLSEDLSLGSLANQSGFSAYYFARLFRLATGQSPHQFVLRQRIARAQRLLHETELPVAQVAAACGFASQSHLTQVFKRYLGHTPRAYRRDHVDGAYLDEGPTEPSPADEDTA